MKLKGFLLILFTSTNTALGIWNSKGRKKQHPICKDIAMSIFPSVQTNEQEKFTAVSTSSVGEASVVSMTNSGKGIELGRP